MHLTVNHWIDQATEPDEVLADKAAIDALVRHAFDIDANMIELATYPESLPGTELVDLIRSISKPYNADLFYRDGGTVGDADYDRYTAGLNLEQLPPTVAVRFGMVLARADMRAWPTGDVVFKTRETIDLDRFQENGLFPADVVAVLHESADGLWSFVQSYNYAAWVHNDKIAIGDRDAILAYRDDENFLVISGNKAVSNFHPQVPAISELQLDMGCKLPLVSPEDVDHNVAGQNPGASHVVRLPARSDNGGLEFQNALIARNQDVHIGFMPYTRRNLLHQSFKFLGERYGWGHSYNARDCTGLVQEVFKTFGIVLPRNSAQQGKSPTGINTRFGADAPVEEKLDALADADVGDLIFSTGHVMLYLGVIDGEPYVIHDLSGSGWIDDDGNFQEGVLNGVSVTPLTKVHSTPDATYFDQMYAIKRLR